MNAKTYNLPKSIAKIVVAIALTLTVITSSGVIADQIGLDIVESVYAGDTCGSSSGGGC